MIVCSGLRGASTTLPSRSSRGRLPDGTVRVVEEPSLVSVRSGRPDKKGVLDMKTAYRFAAPATVAAGLLLTACSVSTSPSSLDVKKVEGVLSEQVSETVTVQCSGEIPVQKGLVTECAAKQGDANAVVVITQIDDQGNVDLTIGRYLNQEKLLNFLYTSIERELGVPVEIECPADIPLEAGLETECWISDGELEGTLYVTQKDNMGAVSWELQ